MGTLLIGYDYVKIDIICALQIGLIIQVGIALQSDSWYITCHKYYI